jgi:hypothetical protein
MARNTRLRTITLSAIGSDWIPIMTGDFDRKYMEQHAGSVQVPMIESLSRCVC